MINLIADQHGISDYVDLAQLEKSELTEPVLPGYSEVKIGTTNLADLDATQKTELNMLIERYKLAMRAYTVRTDALKLLNTHIIATVDRSNMLQLTGIKLLSIIHLMKLKH